MTTLLSGIIKVQDNLNMDLLRGIERCEDIGNSNSLRIEKCEKQGARHSKEIELLKKEFTSELSRYAIKEEVKIPYVFTAPPRNDYFSGRKEEIQELKRILKVEETRNEKKVGVAAVWGLGGIGKTSLVSEYAHQMKEFYKGGVYWFSAEDDTFLEKTVNDIALKIGALLGSFDLTLSNILRKISSANDPSLIVLDCLDQQLLSPNMMKFLSFPSKENIFGHFVVLTRRNPTLLVNEIAILKEDSFLHVKCFLSQEAKNFIFSRTSVTCDEAVESVAESLSEELGRLPLALEQAGACIKILGCSLSSYLEQYKSERLKLLSQQMARSASPGNESPERLAVHTTWCINMEHIKKSPNGQAAVTFMNACSFFNANEIEKELINVGSPEVKDKAFHQCVSLPLGCRQIMKLLTDFSLFTSVKANSVSTHRLVQEIVRENLGDALKVKSLADAVRILSYAFSKCPSPSCLESSDNQSIEKQKIPTANKPESPSHYYMWSKLCLHGHYLRRHVEALLESVDSAYLESLWCSATAKIFYECAVHLSANHKQEEAKYSLNFAYRILDWLPVADYEMIKTTILDNSLFPLAFPLVRSSQIVIKQSCTPPLVSLQPLTQKPDPERRDFDLKQKIEKLRLDGKASYQGCRYIEAINAYSAAISLAKDCSNAFDPLLLTNRAMVYIRLKQYEDALKDANDYITRRPDCWKGYARKALALDGLNEKVSAEIAASLAFYHRRGIFQDFQPFKETFSALQERISICDSVDQLRRALSSSIVKLSALKILVLGSRDYTLNSHIVGSLGMVIDNCILVGTRMNRSVALKLEGNLCIHLVDKCMITNLSFYCNEGQVSCFPGSFVKILNCYFTNASDTHSAVITQGKLNVEQCEFTNSQGTGLVCLGPGEMVVVGCYFCNNMDTGLVVDRGGTLIMRNSHTFNNCDSGLTIGFDSKCFAINCGIHHNDLLGITIRNSKDNTLIRNNIFGNGCTGIYVINSEANIRENKIFDNGDWGIWSERNSRCNISTNAVFRNKSGGVRVQYRPPGQTPSPSVVECNKIYDNSGPGFLENVLQFGVDLSCTNTNLMQSASCKDNEVHGNKDSKKVVKVNLSIPYCSNCHSKREVKRCGKCFTAAYCNKTCQRNHWSKHKELCKVLLEKSSFVITSIEKVPSKDRTEQVEGEKKIGRNFSPPPPHDGSRFVVKVHHVLQREVNEKYTLILYDRSLELYGKFDSKYISGLVKEFGLMCERKCNEKKLFLYCWFDKDEQPRLFTNEFAEFQDW